MFDTPEEMVAKMLSQGSDFDIIVTVTPENVGKLGFGGLIQPLNKSYIPNFGNVWQSLQSPLYDVDSNYTVPYTVYTTGSGIETTWSKTSRHRKPLRHLLDTDTPDRPTC